MELWLADPPLFGGPGQGGRQIVELFVAFGLTALIGLEREIQGKSAGLRTQAIVGTSAALILLISKYGWTDVLNAGTVMVDPSRVAAQIVSGIGFLGAGLIITRRGAVHGLTTAAAVWESAAIGMAAGAGLLLLAVTVTDHALHHRARLHPVGWAPAITLGRLGAATPDLRRRPGRDGPHPGAPATNTAGSLPNWRPTAPRTMRQTLDSSAWS